MGGANFESEAGTWPPVYILLLTLFILFQLQSTAAFQATHCVS